MASSSRQHCHDPKVDRALGMKVLNQFVHGWSQWATPELAAETVSSLFAENGTFCSVGSCIVGRANIRQFIIDYLTPRDEANQFLIIRKFDWDQEHHTGTAQMTWNATVLTPNFIPGVGANEGYSQDDAHIFVLDKHGKVSSWSEYFNPSQTVAHIFTGTVPCK